jgi:hypothetical protein
VQTSRDKHAELAKRFSLAVWDIAPLLEEHSTAVGLYAVRDSLYWLKVMSAKQPKLVHLYQI